MSPTVKIVIVSAVAVLAAGAGVVLALGRSAGPSTEVTLAPAGSPTSGASRGLETGAPGDGDAADVLLRSAGGPVSEEVVEELAAASGATVRQRYLVGELSDGTPVVGLDPADAPLRAPDGTRLEARFVAGRRLGPTEVAPVVAIVGLTWAEAHQTVYGYQVAGMIQDHPAPVELEGTEVRVMDVVVTGDETADRSVFTTLDVAQQLLGEAGRVSWVVVELAPGADRESFERAAREAGFETLDR